MYCRRPVSAPRGRVCYPVHCAGLDSRPGAGSSPAYRRRSPTARRPRRPPAQARKACRCKPTPAQTPGECCFPDMRRQSCRAVPRCGCRLRERRGPASPVGGTPAPCAMPSPVSQPAARCYPLPALPVYPNRSRQSRPFCAAFSITARHFSLPALSSAPIARSRTARILSGT